MSAVQPPPPAPERKPGDSGIGLGNGSKLPLWAQPWIALVSAVLKLICHPGAIALIALTGMGIIYWQVILPESRQRIATMEEQVQVTKQQAGILTQVGVAMSSIQTAIAETREADRRQQEWSLKWEDKVTKRHEAMASEHKSMLENQQVFAKEHAKQLEALETVVKTAKSKAGGDM